VLIAYENEAITAQQKGEDVDYVTPDQTVLIQNPIAVTTTATPPDAARAFVEFTLSADAQQVFADKGYRPVLAEVLAANAATYPVPPALFTIDDLGGWESFRAEFFDPRGGHMADIFAGRGFARE
jgi:sulfate transport system substrate-binding protein